MRRGSIHPSDRKYWLRINTSVCLTSRPSVHFGQNCLPGSVTSFSTRPSRGDVLYSLDISKVLPHFSTFTSCSEAKSENKRMNECPESVGPIASICHNLNTRWEIVEWLDALSKHDVLTFFDVRYRCGADAPIRRCSQSIYEIISAKSEQSHGIEFSPLSMAIDNCFDT